jgi:hypothetical protein
MDKKSRIDRRRFLTSCAIGAGLAPFAHLARSRTLAHTADAPQANLCYASNPEGVLRASDLRYLGSFRMPSDGVFSDAHPPYYFNFSGGALTGRRVGGVPTLLIQGTPNPTVARVGPEVMELSIPTPSISTPPRAGLVRTWQDVRNGKDLAANGTPGQSVTIQGLAIDPDNPDHLWIGYKGFYNNDPNPNTFLTILNDDGTCASFGPWRHGGGGYPIDPTDSTGATFAHLTPVPVSMRSMFGGKRLASGGVDYSYLAGISYGCNLHAWNPVLPSTNPDSILGTGYAISDVPLLHFPNEHRQRRLIEGVNFKLCDWVVQYDATQGAVVTDPEPIFGGAVGRTTRDNSTCAVMVDTGTKRGVVFFGQLVDTIAGHVYENGSPQIAHSWYGTNTIDKNGKRAGDEGYLGPNCCPHGQVDIVHLATGQGGGTIVGYCWIFDPADLANVANRSIRPWEPDPVAAFRISSIQDCDIPDQIKVHRQYGGAWFDEVSKRIYLSAASYDTEGCCSPVPRIHVFQVQ